MIRISALSSLLVVLLGPSCDAGQIPGPEDFVLDRRPILVPPPEYPASDNATVTQVGNGTSTLRRSASGTTADLAIAGQAVGNVLVYATIVFNYPQYCVAGEDRLPEPGPCRGNGPTDPRDGAIPEVRVSADAWASTVVGADGSAQFHVDLTNDAPLQQINGGPGMLNPMGAVVFVYVMDKGPLVAEGPLRGAQLNSLYGGCQGPPAMGPLPCRGTVIVQHLPK